MPILAEVGGLWADALDPIVRKWFEQGFSRRPSLLGTLFNVQSSARAYEEVSGIGAIGIDSWVNFENGDGVSEVDFDQGYKKTYTHQEFIVDLQIRRKFLDDNQFPQITNPTMRLGDSAALRRETDGASVFNNAFTDTAPYAGADAVGLCSTAHPFSPQKTGTTQSNEGTRALTKDNVAATREDMMAFTDDTGNKVAVTPDTILVPPALEDEGLEITKSLLDPTSANNKINPQSGRFSIVTWHYLTDSNAWFMIDSALMKMSLDWFDRVPLSIRLRDGDDRTVAAYWRAYMRYSYGWSDWRWVFGNNPS